MVFEKVQEIIAKELNVSLDKITMDTHLVCLLYTSDAADD